MTTVQYGDTAPIAALASASGPAAIALIRLSGEGCIAALARIFSRPAALLQAAGHQIVYGTFLSATREPIDEVLISVFRAPRSFTGEESAEITCHGGPLIARRILETLHGQGIRPALPGEFSFRAFFNGKIDLTQAEAIMDLVHAPSDRARAMALRRLEGALRRELEEIRREIIAVLAAAELYLDYSEEDISLEAHEEEVQGKLPQQERLESLLPRIERLLAHWKRERLWLEGATVVLVGAPNAGKSSLFNYLLREERALTSEIPGTTRDWLEARFVIEGIPLRLIDSAGLRETEHPIEKVGIARVNDLIDEADIAVLLRDSTQTAADQETALRAISRNTPHIKLMSKADLQPIAPPGYIPISVKTGIGIEEFLKEVVRILSKESSCPAGEGNEPYAIGIASERQKLFLEEALAHLKEALAMAQSVLPLDLIAPHIRMAVEAIASITGEITRDDIFETMFSRFCVGK